MAISWHPSLEIGIQVIDEQHRHFVGLVNQLLEGMEQGRGSEAVRPLAAALAQYANAHFTTEEAAMATHGYPEAKAHRAQHDDYRARVAALAEANRQGQTGSELVIRYGHLLQQWLRDHIASEDRQFGIFLRERGAALS